MSKLRDAIEFVTTRKFDSGAWKFEARFTRRIQREVLDDRVPGPQLRDDIEDDMINQLECDIIQMTAGRDGISDKDRMDALESMVVQYEIFTKYAGPNIRGQIDKIILASRQKRK